MLCYYLSILVVCSIYLKSTNGWDIPSSNQYHIQTDEGPERYFRYQTDSGQYRKEKRLEDGTVVGTYAWIDDDGFLRQRDYIADEAGYRILNTKNVYVGRNIPVGKAVKAAKKYSAVTGDFLKHSQRPIETVPFKTNLLPDSYGPSTLKYTNISPIISTTPKPYEDISTNSILSTTSAGILTSTISPIVDIIPNSIYSTSVRPLLLPPKNSAPNYDTRKYGSTSSSIDYREKLTPYYQSTPTPFTGYLPSHTSLQNIPSTQANYDAVPNYYGDYNETPKKISQNDLDYNPYVSHLQNAQRFQNGPTYPLDQNGKIYVGHNSENEYDPRYQNYNGVSITNDGFRYYIPRAYHEEQSLSGDRRTGSFGYIDPFGIRRVIYYNTSPGSGFQHKKNNRYVGFQATPYDPRPQ